MQTIVRVRQQKTAQRAGEANDGKDDCAESSGDELASDGDSSDDYDPKDKLLHILHHWMRESVDYNKLVIEPYELTEKDLVGPFKDTLERGWPFVEKEHDEDVGDNLLKYNCSFDSLKRNNQKSLRVLTRQVYVSEQDEDIEVEVHGLQIFLFNEHTQLFEKQYDTVIDMFNKELEQEQGSFSNVLILKHNNDTYFFRREFNEELNRKVLQMYKSSMSEAQTLYGYR